MANALELKLNKSGFEAKAVFDGQAAIDEMSKEKYDLLLLDLMMPKMDGITTLRALRGRDEGKDIPVIMLTNLADDDRVAEATANGSLHYLIKSNWKIEDLVKKVKEKIYLE